MLSTSVGTKVAVTGRSDNKVEDAKEATTAFLLRLIKFSDLLTVTTLVSLSSEAFRRYLGPDDRRILLHDANDAHRMLQEIAAKRYRVLCGLATLLVSEAAVYNPVFSLVDLFE